MADLKRFALYLESDNGELMVVRSVGKVSKATLNLLPEFDSLLGIRDIGLGYHVDFEADIDALSIATPGEFPE